MDVFQSDSIIVNNVYETNDNYIIEYDNDNINDICAIYFSSNFIYYPNNENSFTHSIIENNRFEWTKQKNKSAHKHIFLRDIKKQWYLSGINNHINSPDKILKFLLKETTNYKIITIGSSAGGYAAVLFGQLLAAEKTYCFNGQFELLSLLEDSTEAINPLIFRHQTDPFLFQYYDLIKFIKNPKSLYYFVSIKSDWDKSQLLHINNVGINIIYFNTSHHGVPFPKIALDKLFKFENYDFNQIICKCFHPVFFSIKYVGIMKTLTFLIKTISNKTICLICRK